MDIKFSYNEDFDILMENLKNKYGEELFNIDGIGKQLDINKFSKDFFNTKTTAADCSSDPNSNVDVLDSIAYVAELPKPIFRLNSYYLLWKTLKKLYGKQVADEIIEMQLTGDIYINDFTQIQSPYSYHPGTFVVIRENEKVYCTSLSKLFDKYLNEVEELPDRQQINLENKNIEILENNNRFVNLKYILRHKCHNDLVALQTTDGYTTIVTEDHPVILKGGNTVLARDLTPSHQLEISDSTLPLLDLDEKDPDLSYLMGYYVGNGFLGTYHPSVNSSSSSDTTTNGSGEKRDTVLISMIFYGPPGIKDSKVYSAARKIFSEQDQEILLDPKRDDKFIILKQEFINKNYDVGITPDNRRLPSDILLWKRNSIYDFLSGIIDSDIGSINTKTGKVEIKSNSYTLMEQIADLLRALGEKEVHTHFSDMKKFPIDCVFSENKCYEVSFFPADIDNFKSSEKLDKNKLLVLNKRNNSRFFSICKDKDLDSYRGKIESIHRISFYNYVYDITTESGVFHSQGLLQHNCFNFSTYDIMLQGLPMIKKIISIPPKYLYSFKSQLEQFIVIGANAILGATGLADLFIVMSHYVDNILESKEDAHFRFSSEEDCWNYIKETLVSFIYTVNQPQRGGLQSPFTNVSVYDDVFLDSLLKDGAYCWNGKLPNKDTIKKLQVFFLDTMNEELRRTPITFPVVTACFCVDENNDIIDKDFVNLIAEKNLDFGFINIYCGKVSTLSSCCRLRSNTQGIYGIVDVYTIKTDCGTVLELEHGTIVENKPIELYRIGDTIDIHGNKEKIISISCKETKEYTNNFGAGSTKIGSLGVVTLNLPRMAFRAIREHGNNGDSERKLFEILEKTIRVAGMINNAKRHIIKKRINNDRLPLYTLGFMDLNRQYSTVGMNGIHELCEIMGYDVLTDEGLDFIKKILNFSNNINDQMQKEYRAPHNMEQTPSEASAVKLAMKDAFLGYHRGEYKLYSNQFVPLTKTANLLDRIRIQGELDKCFSGGAIAHLNIEQKINDPKLLSDLILSCARKGVIYFAINYNIQRCVEGHMSVGRGNKCSVCYGDIVENYTRVVGYLVNVKNWNTVRREIDYPNRQFYNKINYFVGEQTVPITTHH